MTHVHYLSVLIALSALTGCSSRPHLLLVSGQDSTSEVPDDCVLRGDYYAVDLEQSCTRRTGRIAVCGPAISSGDHGCFHDADGELWFGTGGYPPDVWATVGWEYCSLEELALVEDFEVCTAP